MEPRPLHFYGLFEADLSFYYQHTLASTGGARSTLHPCCTLWPQRVAFVNLDGNGALVVVLSVVVVVVGRGVDGGLTTMLQPED